MGRKTPSTAFKDNPKIIPPHITEIPQDLLILIFSELSREDLLAVHKTCKTFQKSI
ncbi:MAG: F-box protein [Parachlamydiaceae bacterium]|nr:MAG: F-box protein [Parachlamydiaceae bacterium]